MAIDRRKKVWMLEEGSVISEESHGFSAELCLRSDYLEEDKDGVLFWTRATVCGKLGWVVPSSVVVGRMAASLIMTFLCIFRTGIGKVARSGGQRSVLSTCGSVLSTGGTRKGGIFEGLGLSCALPKRVLPMIFGPPVLLPPIHSVSSYISRWITTTKSSVVAHTKSLSAATCTQRAPRRIAVTCQLSG
ncbi:uncharacterized protein CANTADRAFT_273539 [Suhomyces tanzawaensis NRRL Y-17324]|uniref:Uncharacterized protein n=1 Tax=Suhomyces tanzawaensis NRRL Y-17324 TaxID=984487 RepID=A0A1E4SGV1_9ASCO|nr:uncharacterized protein CANTADRAFT_273539 [Suhomyces tanzawaensis NRRL Y-17324]ODV78734.1 hypothetical protein CANTADRAFT_273539 [Suhomyces tanzawaensis NRRL Y-17324]